MKLKGLRVVSFESRHAKTLSDLIRLQGGEPFSAPSMKEIPLEENAEVFKFAEKWLAGDIDAIILLTGVGTRALADILETKFSKEKILELFRRTILVPRGPKPIRVLKEWEVPFAVTVPEPNTWRELLETLDSHGADIPLSGKTIAVQEYGVPNPELIQGLERRGARVFRVPVYRWALPDDLEPLKQAVQKILGGTADVVMFTTAVQIKHLFQVAERGNEGAETASVSLLRESLNRMVVASVGPDCSEALRSYGIGVDIEPESPKMGPLVLETANRAAGILKRKREVENGAVDVRRRAPDTATINDLRQSLFLKACRLEETSRTPVWLMRQAGRYMKDYREVREKRSFLELCKDPSLVAEVTVTAQEKIKADAAILFSDILLIVEPFGLHLDYVKGDGPSIKGPIRSSEDVDRLKDTDPRTSLAYVLEGVRQCRRSLSPLVPLIGFAGAPFTVASYMIEGGSSKNFSHTIRFMREDASRWKVLMEKITDVTLRYLDAQADAGIQAVQLFDSWAGILTPEEYDVYAAPYSGRILQTISKKVCTIHFGTRTGPFLESFSRAGGQVVGVDHRIGLKEARERVGPRQAIQGNLDPAVLLQDLRAIEKEVARILGEAGKRPGHIFNLGHGVLPETPVENVIALVEMVKEMSAK